MDNIYHQYWQQELMYQLASADRYRKRAYVCSPFRADTREQREKYGREDVSRGRGGKRAVMEEGDRVPNLPEAV